MRCWRPCRLPVAQEDGVFHRSGQAWAGFSSAASNFHMRRFPFAPQEVSSLRWDGPAHGHQYRVRRLNAESNDAKEPRDLAEDPRPAGYQ